MKNYIKILQTLKKIKYINNLVIVKVIKITTIKNQKLV